MNLEQFDVKSLVGKEMTVGFGRDENRLVLDWQSGGVTFIATADAIEIAPAEPISMKISPPGVICEEADVVFAYQIVMKLGRHRFLTAISQAEGVLKIFYLPDEQDIETGSSEFMKQLRC